MNKNKKIKPKKKTTERKNKDKIQIYFEKSDFIFWIKKCIHVKFRMFSFPLISQNTFQILLTVLRTVKVNINTTF